MSKYVIAKVTKVEKKGNNKAKALLVVSIMYLGANMCCYLLM
jgi:hypothetical protein